MTSDKDLQRRKLSDAGTIFKSGEPVLVALRATRSRVRVLDEEGTPGVELRPRLWLVQGGATELEFSGDPPGVLWSKSLEKFAREFKLPDAAVLEKSGWESEVGTVYAEAAAGFSSDESLDDLMTALGQALGIEDGLLPERTCFLMFDCLTLAAVRAESLPDNPAAIVPGYGPLQDLVEELRAGTWGGTEDEYKDSFCRALRDAIPQAKDALAVAFNISQNLNFAMNERKQAVRDEVSLSALTEIVNFTPEGVMEPLRLEGEGPELLESPELFQISARLLKELFSGVMGGLGDEAAATFFRAWALFADGQLRLVEAAESAESAETTEAADISETFNGEPDGEVFFTLAEFALGAWSVGARDGWDQELLTYWRVAAALSVESEKVYVRRYSAEGGRTPAHLATRTLQGQPLESVDTWLSESLGELAELREESGDGCVDEYVTRHHRRFALAVVGVTVVPEG